MSAESWCSKAVAVLLISASSFEAAGEERQLVILDEVRRAYGELETLQCEVVVRRTAGGKEAMARGHAYLSRPNLFRIELDGDFARTAVSDGAHQWMLIPEAERCLKSPVGHARNLDLLGLKPLALFFGHGFTFGAPVKPDEVFVREESEVFGIPCQMLELHSAVLGRQRLLYYVGPDRLVHRVVAELQHDGLKVRYDVSLVRIERDEPLDAARFAFIPPDDCFVQDEAAGELVLKEGAPLPEATLEDTAGREVSLAEVRRRAKAVLINFWYLRCAPCIAEFPDLARLHEELAPHGLEVLAINASDEAEEIRAFREKRGYPFTMLHGRLRSVTWQILGVEPYGLMTQFGVRSFPTNVVVDREGKVVLRMTGFDEEAIRRSLAELGVESDGPR